MNKTTELYDIRAPYDCKAQLIKRYATLQSRKAFLSQSISSMTQLVTFSKMDMNTYWDLAVPDTKDGEFFFKQYSDARKQYQQDKKDLKHLINMQLELKREMREVSNLISDKWLTKNFVGV